MADKITEMAWQCKRSFLSLLEAAIAGPFADGDCAKSGEKISKNNTSAYATKLKIKLHTLVT